VIGEVGTILGRHSVNIAGFALGRGTSGAVGVVTVEADDAHPALPDGVLEELQQVPAIRSAHLVRLS
jgi:D-3-phosphoglycerate dehydrogenase